MGSRARRWDRTRSGCALHRSPGAAYPVLGTLALPSGAAGGCDTPRCPLQGSNVAQLQLCMSPIQVHGAPACGMSGGREPGVLMLSFLQVVASALLDTANH